MAGLIIRAGIIWTIVAILLTIIGNVLAPLLPVVAGPYGHCAIDAGSASDSSQTEQP
jgi:hypothetical protein